LSQATPLGLPGAVRPDTDSGVRASIARAAQATGVDFNYLLAQAKIESSLNPTAKAGTSSAAGLYQFTNGTWLQMLDRHGAEHGLDWAGSAIEGGRVSDPTMRAQIMSMRYDADTSALMAGELANENKQALTGVLGREPDSAELYMAHFLGADGASRFLSALQADPTQSAAGILPKAASANRAIFYDGSGAPRSVSGVMELMRGKVSSAMDGASGMPFDFTAQGAMAAASPAAPTFVGGPIAREFQAAAATTAAASPARTSMADTLRSTFGTGGGSAGTPDFVRNAYSKLQAFNL
jgi:hypothetical protein